MSKESYDILSELPHDDLLHMFVYGAGTHLNSLSKLDIQVHCGNWAVRACYNLGNLSDDTALKKLGIIMLDQIRLKYICIPYVQHTKMEEESKKLFDTSHEIVREPTPWVLPICAVPNLSGHHKNWIVQQFTLS